MISKHIRPFSLVYPVILCLVASCSNSSSVSSTGTSVTLAITPAAVNHAAMTAGSKTFTTTEGVQITLNKAYLVISNSSLTTSCGVDFSARTLLNQLIPSANAHTSQTPTATGEPVVINILNADNSDTPLGNVSPPAGDYCGVELTISAADVDASGLPNDADMVGASLFISGSYSQTSPSAQGAIHVETGATLISRKLLLASLVMLSPTQLNGAIDLEIHYDTWFDTVDLAALETETASSTSPVSPQVSQLLSNVTASIHQK